MISIGTFDNFNHRGCRRQRLDRTGRRADQRNADDEVAGRGRHRIRPARRSGFASRRFRLGDLSSAQGSALARRQAGDPGRRDFLDRSAEEIQPDVRVVLPPRRQDREDRRTRHQVHFRRPGQSRTADHRRRIAGAAEALLGRHRQPGPQARHLGDDAGAAAGLGPLSHQGIRRGPLGRAGAGQGLLGRAICRSGSARTISTKCASSISATTWWRWKPSRPTRPTGSRENSAKQWATPV